MIVSRLIVGTSLDLSAELDDVVNVILTIKTEYYIIMLQGDRLKRLAYELLFFNNRPSASWAVISFLCIL